MLLMILLGICAFIAIVVVFKKITNEKLDKSEAEFLAKINNENNTDFRSDRKLAPPGIQGTRV